MANSNWKERNGVWVETTLGVAVRVFENVAVDAEGNRRLLGMGARPLRDGLETQKREVWLHFVQPDGTTYFQTPETDLMRVDIARASSIPKARRAGLTDAQLAAQGYR